MVSFLHFSTLLPGYELDFGFVILGDIVTKSVRLINNGFCPVTLYFLRSALQGSGFLIDLDRIRGLPGAPDYEITEFRVHFDPRGSNLDLGPVQCEVPMHVGIFVSFHYNMPQLNFTQFWMEYVRLPDDISLGFLTVLMFPEKKIKKCGFLSPKINFELFSNGKSQVFGKKIFHICELFFQVSFPFLRSCHPTNSLAQCKFVYLFL